MKNEFNENHSVVNVVLKWINLCMNQHITEEDEPAGRESSSVL